MKISILLITYNHEKYIAEAVKSILLQRNVFETEIIVLDDCSTDQTLEIASSLLIKIKNVKAIKNKTNLGITKNYKKGFSLCTGEYVFVLEGDDYWIDPYKIKCQVDFLDENPFCSMCFHPFLTQKNESGVFENFFKNENASYSDFFSINHLILNEGLIANFSVCCYRKAALNKIPDEVFNITSYDWMVNMEVAQFGFLGRINKPMSVYRLSETGLWSNKILTEKLNETLTLIPMYDKVLQYKYSDLFNKKIQILTEQITQNEKIEVRSFKSFIPPIFIYVLKLLMPPGLLNFIKNKNV